MKTAFHIGGWGTDHIFQALGDIRTAGIRAVEVYADVATVYDGKPQEFSFFLQKGGLSLVGAYGGGVFSDPDFREADVESARVVARWLKRAGGRFLILQGGERGERPADDLKAVAVTANLIGKACQREGVEFCFQPHTDTPIFAEDEIRAFLGKTDPATVLLCADTGHMGEAGMDLIPFLAEHGERIRVVHLRDLRPKPVFVGSPFANAGKGTLHLAATVAALRARGFHGWIVGFADDRSEQPAKSVRQFAEYARGTLRLTPG